MSKLVGTVKQYLSYRDIDAVCQVTAQVEEQTILLVR